MTKKFYSIQKKAQQVIYGLHEINRSELISINNHKKIKVVIKIFKYRQGTSCLHLEVMHGSPA